MQLKIKSILKLLQKAKSIKHNSRNEVSLTVSKSASFYLHQKMNKNIFVFLPYRLKRDQIKKIRALYTTNWRIFILTLLPYFFDMTSFYRLGQKYKNIYVRFLVQMKTLKFAFKIYWPLVRVIIEVAQGGVSSRAIHNWLLIFSLFWFKKIEKENL